jgi:localization factor PodJL
MKPGVPWSVKGIEADAREAAKVAARKSGMTLGEWLNSKILESAQGEGKVAPAGQRQPRAGSGHVLERTASRLEDIAEQLSRLSLRDSGTAPQTHAAPPVEQDSLGKILSRVESNERQTVEAFTAVNDRLSILGRQFAQATKRNDARPEDSPGYMALEKAVRNIVEHMETSEKRTRDNFKSLHDRMATISQKAASAPLESVAKQAPAFTQLETRLADLARRVENSSAQNTLPDLLKSELTELANRIDTVRETAESLASRAQTQAVQTSQQELRAIENRIVGLIKEAQASLSGNMAGPAELQRLRGEVERLNMRIDEASRTQANGGDVMALRAAVEQLSTRVAQGPDLRPLADMDRRILEITQRLEAQQAQARNLPQVNDLDRRITELDHKLTEAALSREAHQADEIEGRLSDIAGRVERTEQQLGSLETIERAVNQLFESLEQQRNWTQDIAEGAANRMAQTVLSQMPQQVSLNGAPEISALQEGLQAVKAAAATADTRNQETLEAVHETLEQIVSKLAELETATIGQRVASAVAQPVMPEIAPPPPAMNAAPVFAPLPEPPPVIMNPLAEAPAVNPFQPVEDKPLENPFDAVLKQTREQADSLPAEGDDFIAAARRAAQAAVQPKSVLNGLAPGAARASEEASKKILGLSFLKPRHRSNTASKAMPLNGELKPPPGFKADGQSDTRKRKYIIMGIALLAAVSVFTFNILGQARKAKAPPQQPAAIEQQLNQQTPAAVPEPTQPAASPEGTKAEPPKPKPAELESNLLPEGSDPVLTGSVEQPGSIADIVAGTEPKDEAMAPKEAGSLQLREAAAMGNAEAQFLIATRYLNGENGTPQDFAKAAYWYGKASAAGNAPAQYRLGTLYERGKGVAKDMKAAIGWYERSAALGNVKAMHNAAVLAASSDQKKPDYGRAFKWFSLGAAHGLKDSQFNLAVLLERGLGTKANAKEALFWYSIAAKQKDADAGKRADALAKSISKADLQETEKRLRLWTPEVAPEAANTVAANDPAWQSDKGDQG